MANIPSPGKFKPAVVGGKVADLDDVTDGGQVDQVGRDGLLSRSTVLRNRTLTVDTVAQLREALAAGVVADVYRVRWHTNQASGGGGRFHAVDPSGLVDDNGVTILGGSLAVQRVSAVDSLTVNPDQFGALVGSGDQTAAVNAAIAWAQTVYGTVILPRTYTVVSVDMTNKNRITLKGVGPKTELVQKWGALALYPLLDMSGACDCVVEDLTLVGMALSMIGVLLTRSTTSLSCNGNSLNRLRTRRDGAWGLVCCAVIGAEVTSFRDCKFFNSAVGWGTLWLGGRMGHMSPYVPISLYVDLYPDDTPQSTLDNTFLDCRFESGGSEGASRVITFSGGAEARFIGGASYSGVSVTGRCHVMVDATDAIGHGFQFVSFLFEGPVANIVEIPGVHSPFTYVNGMTFRDCRKTFAGDWIGVTGELASGVMTQHTQFVGNYGLGHVKLGVSVDDTIDVSSLGVPATSPPTITAAGTIGGHWRCQPGCATITGGVAHARGTVVEYVDVQAGTDSDHRFAIGGRLGAMLHSSPVDVAPSAIRIAPGAGLIAVADGVNWSPCVAGATAPYAVVMGSDDLWHAQGIVTASGVGAATVGVAGTLALSGGALWACVATNTWQQIST